MNDKTGMCYIITFIIAARHRCAMRKETNTPITEIAHAKSKRRSTLQHPKWVAAGGIVNLPERYLDFIWPPLVICLLIGSYLLVDTFLAQFGDPFLAFTITHFSLFASIVLLLIAEVYFEKSTGRIMQFMLKGARFIRIAAAVALVPLFFWLIVNMVFSYPVCDTPQCRYD